MPESGKQENTGEKGIAMFAGNIMIEEKRAGDLSELPVEGLVRLEQILKFLPISRTTFYRKIREGIIAKPKHPFGPSISFWDVKDIRRFWEQLQ